MESLFLMGIAMGCFGLCLVVTFRGDGHSDMWHFLVVLLLCLGIFLGLLANQVGQQTDSTLKEFIHHSHYTYSNSSVTGYNYCPDCGSALPETGCNYCPNCGFPVSSAEINY